jgi:hypothetical protein
MRSIIFVLATVIALPLSAATRLVTTAGADAGDCTAAPCATINYAVGQAVNGDTISVGPGTFASSPVTINKSVVVLGAQAGVDARGRVAAESIVSAGVTLGADNVTFNGFTVTNGGSAGIDSSSSFSGHRIINNIIRHNSNGVFFGSSGASQSIMRFNDIFENFLGSGVYSTNPLTNAVIDQNRFGYCFFSAQIEIFGVTAPASVAITNNTFVDQHPTAILLHNNNGTVISGNTVTGGSSNQFAVLSGSVNIVISGNTVTGAGGCAVNIEADEAFISFGLVGQVTVTGNTFLNNGCGVKAGSGISVPVQMHFNRIIGSPIITSAVSAIIHGENNWFGCNGGPSVCATNSIFAGSTVDLDPWLVMDIAAMSPITLPQTSSVTADFNQNSAGAAVSGFPNGTIVAFSASGGSMSPPTDDTAAGVAASTFTPSAAGLATVSAALDSQTVSANVIVLVPGAIPAMSMTMLALLGAALGAIALVAMRR